MSCIMAMFRKLSVVATLFVVFQIEYISRKHYSFVLSLRIGDEVCVEGYVMDQYCIDLGYLLDNPSIKTLENPGAHSLHCLLDVPVCRGSDYVILVDPNSGTNRTTDAPTTVAPTSIPTSSPTPMIPATSPANGPTFTTFQELLALLPTLTQPSVSPTSAPSLTISPTISPQNSPTFSSFQELLATLPTLTQHLGPPANSTNASTSLVDSISVVDASLNVSSSAAVQTEISTQYRPGYIVDDVGKNLLIQLGRAVGMCSTCDTTGVLRQGLRAEVRGTIVEIGDNVPHKIAVSSVQLSTNLTTICSSLSSVALPSQSPSHLRSSKK